MSSEKEPNLLTRIKLAVLGDRRSPDRYSEINQDAFNMPLDDAYKLIGIMQNGPTRMETIEKLRETLSEERFHISSGEKDWISRCINLCNNEYFNSAKSLRSAKDDDDKRFFMQDMQLQAALYKIFSITEEQLNENAMRPAQAAEQKIPQQQQTAPQIQTAQQPTTQTVQPMQQAIPQQMPIQQPAIQYPSQYPTQNTIQTQNIPAQNAGLEQKIEEHEATAIVNSFNVKEEVRASPIQEALMKARLNEPQKQVQPTHTFSGYKPKRTYEPTRFAQTTAPNVQAQTQQQPTTVQPAANAQTQAQPAQQAAQPRQYRNDAPDKQVMQQLKAEKIISAQKTVAAQKTAASTQKTAAAAHTSDTSRKRTIGQQQVNVMLPTTNIDDIIEEYAARFPSGTTGVKMRMHNNFIIVEAYCLDHTMIIPGEQFFEVINPYARKEGEYFTIKLGPDAVIDARSENASFGGTLINPARIITKNGHVNIVLTQPYPLSIISANGNITVNGVMPQYQQRQNLNGKVCYHNGGTGPEMFLRAEGKDSAVVVSYDIGRK